MASTLGHTLARAELFSVNEGPCSNADIDLQGLGEALRTTILTRPQGLLAVVSGPRTPYRGEDDHSEAGVPRSSWSSESSGQCGMEKLHTQSMLVSHL